jgi:hypothetical protein
MSETIHSEIGSRKREEFNVSEYPRAKKRTNKFCGERHTVLYRNAETE